MVLPTSVTARQVEFLKDYYSKPLAQRVPEAFSNIASNVSTAVRNIANGDLRILDWPSSSPAGSPAGEVPVNQNPFTYGEDSNSQNPYDKQLRLIQQITAENNAWSAEQAQKQMDFQLMMSNTAHQREMADLKAAGLNPVLTATGGNGAAVTSGAMAQPDMSNTRAIADLAMAAIEGMQNTAVGVAGSTGKGSLFKNPYVNRFLSTAAGSLAGKLVKDMF